MKTYIKTIITSFVVGLVFLACTEDEIETYKGRDLIYFEWAKDGMDYSANRIDSLPLSFAYNLPSYTDSIFKIPVKVQGYTSSEDRVVNISVSSESTALTGTHIDIPDMLVIPADSVRAYLPVTIHRTEDMKDDIFTLKLLLSSNDNFDTDIFGEAKSANADRLVEYTEFQLTISDILVEPSKWVYLKGWLGDFSAKKLYLLAEVNNMDVPNYNEFPSIGEMFSHIAVLKAYLQEQSDNGTPVLNDDGTEMFMGPSA